MRGARRERVGVERAGGIIPAYAGSTQPRSWCRAGGWDHPRVCGEHARLRKAHGIMAGSSPRMRGALVRLRPVLERHGIIPAYAGSTFAGQTVLLLQRIIPAYAGSTTWVF